MAQYLQIERGGLVNTRHIQFIFNCDDGSAFAVVNSGLECLEVDNHHYAGFRLAADYETVCLILGDSDE
jgi:hypothetical protein